MRRAGEIALVLLLSAFAVAPLAGAPFFASDDGLFHLYRLAALDDALRHGELFPRLFPDFAFGYGQAVLAYYGPLPYYIAEMFHWLGAGFADAIKWTFALGYAGSGAAFHTLARRYVPALPALAGAAAYIYFPYHIAETYQRGALAEHLAFVWLPLVLVPASKRGLLFCLGVAALILTHSLTALIFLPFALAWQWFAAPRAERSSVRLAAQFALPLLLTAFYWAPVAGQSRWVGLSAGLEHTGYLAHLAPLMQFLQPALPYRYAPQQVVASDYPLSPLSAALLVLALISAWRAWQMRAADAPPRLLTVVLAMGALGMATSLAEPLWRLWHNPLAFLQYPWRFLTLAALGIALGAAFALAGSRGARPNPVTQAALLALLALIVWTGMAQAPFKPLAAAPADTAAMWQSDFQNRQIGATWTAEYVPWWTQADRTAIPAASRAPVSAVGVSAPDVRLIAAGYSSFDLRVTTAQPASLRLHQFYLPQWRATLDGTPLPLYASGDLGLLTADVPPVRGGALRMTFGQSALEQSALALSAVAGAWIMWRYRGRWLIAPAALALAGVWLLWQAGNAQPVRTVEARVADFADLLGVRADRAAYRPGETAQVTLFWLARQRTAENFKGFVHLVDSSGRVLAQSDGDPAGGFTPTTRWQAGELIAETRPLAIPADAAPGALAVVAGMYRFDTLENLPAAGGGTTFSKGRIPLGELTVVAH